MTAKIYGQTGNTQSNPIVLGTFSSAFSYSNSQNTGSFTNNYTDARSTNDVYYKFTLNKKMEVTMRHCGSTLSDTYLTLLDASLPIMMIIQEPALAVLPCTPI
jgi:hypothetical protein